MTPSEQKAREIAAHLDKMTFTAYGLGVLAAALDAEYKRGMLDAAAIARTFPACFHGDNCPVSECDCPVEIAYQIRTARP